jgi:hypothetical protein
MIGLGRGIAFVSSKREVADQVFILRFWREDAGCGEDFRWRAQVRNVNTRQRQTTDDVDAAFALVLARLNAVVVENGSTDR